MTSPDDVRRRALTEEYRQRAETVRKAATRDLLRLWPMLDVNNLDHSWPALQRALELMVQDHRHKVAQAAKNYLTTFALIEDRAGDLDVLLASRADPVALRTSLLVTGPIRVKENVSRGATATLATGRALVAVTGVVSRAVLNGGRQTIIDTVGADRDALGWMRVTHGKTCAFCAMLASRGPVYKTRSTAGDPRGRPARFHDHCDCTVEPVFSTAQEIPEASQQFDELWAASTAGLSGADARNAFRIAYEDTYLAA